MRVTKINDHEIHFEMTDSDLSSRDLTLSQLKYGDAGTMKLFKEVVQTASAQYGFNSDSLPVKIEAVPTPDNGLLLIVSAMDDPEELDAHFAHYSAEDTLAPVQDQPAAPVHETFYEENPGSPALRVCLISFPAIDDVIRFCKNIGNAFPGLNELYLRETDHTYFLALIRGSNMSEKDFVVFLNSITEYGDIVPDSAITYAFLREHSKPCMRDPLSKLAEI